jgi:hypothetical protein
MGHENRIQFYPEPDLAEKIESRADEEGLTVSKYCEQVFQQHLQTEKEEAQDWRYQTGERIEVVIDQMRADIQDEIESFREELDGEITDLQSLRTMYVISLWELLKDDYGLPQQKEAMKAAGQRLNDAEDGRDSSEEASSPQSDTVMTTD